MTLSISTLFTPAPAGVAAAANGALDPGQTPPPGSGTWYGRILSNAGVFGLPTDKWPPVGAGRSILAIWALCLAAVDNLVSAMIQGGFLDTASTVTADPSLPPFTTGTPWAPGWLDLLAQGIYQQQRNLATPAVGALAFTAGATAAPATFPIGSFHAASSTRSYANTTPVVIAPGFTTSAAFAADVPGASGSAAIGTVTQLVTSVLAVTVTNPAPFIGLDAENNWALVSRCRSKLSTLSVNGPAGAYDYFAKQAGVLLAAQTPPAALTSPVTRTLLLPSQASGGVDLYVASAAGVVPGVSAVPVANVFTTVGLVSLNTIQTAAPHGLSTGQFVSISGIVGRTGANGVWVVGALLDQYNFVLAGSFNVSGAYLGGGVIEGGDLGLVDSVIQANAVPLGISARTRSATAANIVAVVNVWVPAAQAPAAGAAVSLALTSYFASVPIGGSTDPGGSYTNALLYDAVLGAIYTALLPTGATLTVKQATLSLNSSPPGLAQNITLVTTDVPVLFPAPTIVVHGS